MFTQKSQKLSQNFICVNCDYKTCKKSDYSKHLLTLKHQNVDKCLHENLKSLKNKKYVCECGNNYSHRQSFYVHKKKCIKEGNNLLEENKKCEIDTVIHNKSKNNDLITYLMKENSELKNMILDVCKQTQPTNITNLHNTISNSHNKTFNLQFFLNETCKDAMNIMDFVDSIKLQLSDLESVGKLGYVEGISNIIIKNLNELEVEKRPVHCTDSKREVLYVKDENQWYNDSKEENENKKIKKAIKHITHKNSKLLPEFKAKYPDCIYSDSKKSDQYNKIIIESLNDSKENENKIIKKIAKEVVVDK